MQQNVSLAELRKEKIKYNNSNRGKPRGAMAKTYYTRSHSQVRNIFQEHLQNNLSDSEAPREDGMDTLLNSPVMNQKLGAKKKSGKAPQAAIAYEQISQVVGHTDTPFDSPVINRKRDTNKKSSKAPQTGIDYHQINRIIESTVTRMIQNLKLQKGDNPSRNDHSDFDSESNISMHRNSSQNNSRNQNGQPDTSTHSSGERPMSASGNHGIRPDKLTTVIRDWNIRFDGSHNGMSVDEFLYRVKTLTKENLNNDFSQLCKNLPLLLTGKAQDWYWRYHKRVPQIEWDPFCAALKYQYKEFRSSFDIKEEIRNRKMKSNEIFESFYDSITSMLDRLEKSMEEEELIEILTRNLRPDIRHELLYVPIFSIAHLRKLVQMREALLSKDQFRKGMPPKIVSNQCQRRVAEIEFDDSNSCTAEDKNHLIGAVQQSSRPMKCWNCEELGHFREDCESEPNVFCYGCGQKNTYKPQCSKCATRKLWKPKN
ncbi:uncharacterized protein [Musca autumnalis]|uniref:uncharacterized protein n=1 Tax=Musca autumnalis TaxID=221902 RepID=UPI003CF1E77B